MLVLTRKPNQQVHIGNDIVITVVRVRGNTIRLGIEAPKDVRILRSEIEAKSADLSGDSAARESSTPSQADSANAKSESASGSAASDEPVRSVMTFKLNQDNAVGRNFEDSPLCHAQPVSSEAFTSSVPCAKRGPLSERAQFSRQASSLRRKAESALVAHA